MIYRIQTLKSSSDAMSGYSAAISALIGGVQDGTMGIPLSKGKVCLVFLNNLVKILTLYDILTAF